MHTQGSRLMTSSRPSVWKWGCSLGHHGVDLAQLLHLCHQALACHLLQLGDAIGIARPKAR